MADYNVEDFIKPITKTDDKRIVENLFLFTEIIIGWREETRQAKHRNQLMAKLANRKGENTHLYDDILPGHNVCYQGDAYVMVERKPPAGHGDPVTAIIRKRHGSSDTDTTPFEVKWSHIQPLASIMPTLPIPKQHVVDINKYVFVQHGDSKIVFGKVMSQPSHDGAFVMHAYLPSAKMVSWLPLWNDIENEQIRSASPSEDMTPVMIHANESSVIAVTDLEGSKHSKLPKETMNHLVSTGLIEKIQVANDGDTIHICAMRVATSEHNATRARFHISREDMTWVDAQLFNYNMHKRGSQMQRHYRLLHFLTLSLKVDQVSDKQINASSDAADSFVKSLSMTSIHQTGRERRSRVPLMKLMVAFKTSVHHENPWADMATGSNFLQASISAWERVQASWAAEPDRMYNAYAKWDWDPEVSQVTLSQPRSGQCVPSEITVEVDIPPPHLRRHHHYTRHSTATTVRDIEPLQMEETTHNQGSQPFNSPPPYSPGENRPTTQTDGQVATRDNAKRTPLNGEQILDDAQRQEIMRIVRRQVYDEWKWIMISIAMAVVAVLLHMASW